MTDTATPPPTLLAGLRVVDLTTVEGHVCGRILASMGADVVKVEPPGGDSTRGTAADADSLGAARWWAENLGKKSITLNLEVEAGRELLERLLESADVLVHSFTRPTLERLGIDHAELSLRYPRLIQAAITPFGLDGPHSSFEATDLTIQAMGGHMYVTGDDDRAPVRVGVPVAHRHGGAEAAAAISVAYYERQVSGLGQVIDVSMQECVVWTMLNTTMTWELTGRNEVRGGAVRRERSSPIYTRLVWRCNDGLVHFVPVGGGGGRSRVKSWDRLVSWMESEGYGAPILRAKEWNGEHQHDISQEEYDALSAQIQAFLLTKTVAVLYDRAVVDGLLLAPVATVPDVLASRQLDDRQFFRVIEDPALGGPATVPGPFARFTRTPLVPPTRAPRVGEHNREIYTDGLGLSDDELAALTATGVI
ncbi:MAG: hypothetical protein ABS81_09525 [Pseudonocardia sp. SCN 72-86]|nr:MAG: hypothetical protein ABS81_09525 [Pseudonocardia sp. SCN 72-86]